MTEHKERVDAKHAMIAVRESRARLVAAVYAERERALTWRRRYVELCDELGPINLKALLHEDLPEDVP